jgi:hypothetical protein
METKPFSLQAPESIAKEYGGNKQAIAQAAQMGLLDPTAAVLAGMFIDRMRTAAMQEQAPTQTVAQETFAPPAQPQMGMPQGQPQAMPPPMQQGMPPQMQPEMAPQGFAEGGLASLYVPDNMYDYAGGGIVAFQAGGRTTVGGEFGNITPMIQRGIGAAQRYDEDVARKRALSRQVVQKFAGDPTKRDIINQVDRMSVPELETILASVAPTPVNLAANMPVSDAPMLGSGAPPVRTVADLNAMEGNIDRGLRSLPGLTPDQSEANIAAARPPAEEPSAAMPQGMNIADIIRQSDMLAQAISPRPTGQALTAEQAGSNVDALLKQSGFDPELFAKQQQQLETEKESLKEDRKTAQNMRIIEAGLGIMAGTSANAFENIGKGATPAIQGLAKDIKDLKATERALTKSQMDLDTKRNDFALGKAGLTQKEIDKSQARFDDQQKQYVDLQGRIANTMLAGEIQKDIAKSTVGSRMTDFDKKWSIYEEAAKKRGETPSPEGFVKMWGRSDAGTELQQLQFSKGLLESGIPLSDVQSMRQNIFGGQGAQGRYQEGQESKDRSGKPIVFRNGQWVYK